MALHDFGQPYGSIIQTAYVVPDIIDAMRGWTDNLGVGPWFHMEKLTGSEMTYRGMPTSTLVSGAMAYSGHMMIELIQPLDEAPSVFKELIARTGYGFHHVGVSSHDFELDLERYEKSGHEIAFRAKMPTGGSVAYLDTHGRFPGFIELIEFYGPTEAIFLSMHKASLGWDGLEPIRPFGLA